MSSKTKNEIIRSIALKYGLDIDEVEKAVKSQFHATAAAMKKKETSHIRYIGKFQVSPTLQKKINKLTQKKKEDNA